MELAALSYLFLRISRPTSSMVAFVAKTLIRPCGSLSMTLLGSPCITQMRKLHSLSSRLTTIRCIGSSGGGADGSIATFNATELLNSANNGIDEIIETQAPFAASSGLSAGDL